MSLTDTIRYQLFEGLSKYKIGQRVKMLRGEFIGQVGEVVSVENISSDDERYVVKYNGDLYKFEPKGIKPVEKEEEKEKVTESRKSLMLRENYSFIATKADRTKFAKVSEKDFASDKDSDEIADKEFYKKLVIFVEKKLTKLLSGKTTQDKMDGYIRSIITRIEGCYRSKEENNYGCTKRHLYNMYVGNPFDWELKSWLAVNSNETIDAKNEAQKIMNGLTDEKIILAGLLSSAQYGFSDVRVYFDEYLRYIKDGNKSDKQWDALIVALNKVKDISIK